MHLRATAFAILLAALVLAPGATRAKDDDPNLIINGDCEKADAADAKLPAGWSKPDGITTFWDATTGKPGHCLKLDTSVLKVDKQAFADAEASAKAAPPAKGKVGKENQYSTVGAHEGVWFWSNFITVKSDDALFILEADVRAPAVSSYLFYPQIFVRGYQKYDDKRDAGTQAFFIHPRADGPDCTEQFGSAQRAAHEGDLLMVYRGTMVCRLPVINEYQHFRYAFQLPTVAKYRPDVLLIKPYVCWPLGAYYFDNVVLRRCTKAEFDAVKAEGHSIKGFD